MSVCGAHSRGEGAAKESPASYSSVAEIEAPGQTGRMICGAHTGVGGSKFCSYQPQGQRHNARGKAETVRAKPWKGWARTIPDLMLLSFTENLQFFLQ